MNLRVDLILDHERRSASLVNAKSLLRISSIVGPLILLFIIGGMGLNLWRLKKQLDSVNASLTVELPKKQKALNIRSEMNENIIVLKELEGWKGARVTWADQLVGIQKEVPAKIQLDELRVNYDLKPTNTIPARLYTMTIAGTAIGEGADALVDQLKNKLPRAEGMSNSLAALPKIVKFTQPLVVNETNKYDRLFEIDCAYKPGLFQ